MKGKAVTRKPVRVPAHPDERLPKRSAPAGEFEQLRAENAELRAQLAEAEETLRAIRSGEAEALVVQTPVGPRVFTLTSADAASNQLRGELLSHVSDAVVTIDPQQRITFLNPAGQRLYGVKASDALGRKLSEIYTWTWPRPEDEAAAWTALRDQGAWHGENLHHTRDGRKLHVESSVAVIRDAAGGSNGLLAVIRDITARKQWEAALQASERHLRNLLDNLFTFVGVLAPDGTLLEANRAPLQRGGLCREDVVGRKFWDCPWWNYDPQIQAQLQRTCERAAAGEFCRYDVEVRMAGGQLVPIDFALSPLRDAEGRISHLIPSAVDITERKRAEAMMRESEERFRAVANNIPQLAWMADAEGNTIWHNSRWLAYTGDAVEPTSAQAWKTIQPDHITRVQQSWQAAIRAGQPWEDTFPLRGRDGQYRWFLSRAFPIHDDAGRITRWFGTNTDITELREAQDALQLAQTQLQQHAQKLEHLVAERTAKLSDALNELESWSYSIAHDMRAPLRAMQGFSHLLLDDYGPQLDETAQQYLQRIAAAASRLDAMIRDVLNYSKVASGELQLEAIDAGKLVRDLIDTYPALHPSAADILVRDPLPVVRGNEAALTQVLSNLLGNAVKFVAPGVRPRVQVHAETVSQTRIRLWLEDNGIGMASGAEGRIFQMFQRLHPAGCYDGAGMGLAIVRKALERMGGAVGFHSEIGRGSRFWIELETEAAATTPTR